MESLDELTKSGSSKKGFFSYVFNFNEESKEEMLNIIQYAILAIIPLVILNKSIQRFIPEADEEKGSPELVAEVIIQIIVMFLGIFFVNRIITYIPTYSGMKYPELHITNFVLPVLAVVLSLQTKIGEKISILSERCMELWNGKSESTNKKKKGKSQSNQSSQSQSIGQSAITQSLNSQSTPLSQLPPIQQQQSPAQDYNNMYQQDTSSSVGAIGQGTPTGGYEGFAPMAANEALGGSGFGGANW